MGGPADALMKKGLRLATAVQAFKKYGPADALMKKGLRRGLYSPPNGAAFVRPMP